MSECIERYYLNVVSGESSHEKLVNEKKDISKVNSECVSKTHTNLFTGEKTSLKKQK